jgi:hypothetical protein
MRTTDEIVARIRAEYLEMPGLQLTIEQAQRLFGVEQALCKTLLDSLIDTKFLRVDAGGSYVVFAAAPFPAAVPRKAHLGAARRAAKAS